jgi:succinate dehydrogenase / fumarate reductase cytochrome b subunit
MRWTGVVVLAFLIYHLAHFTLGVVQTETFKETPPLNHYLMQNDYRVAGFTVVKAGTVVANVHSMVILGFQHKAVAVFYIVAVGLLSIHLLHGFNSLFQSLGLRNAKWSGLLHKAALALCVLYFLGNLAIPGAVLAGKLQPQTAKVAATAQR